jgi:CDP-glycerol glycerophosphotransferase
MNIVYNSFQGRYSDNPRALYEALRAEGDTHQHVWICDPRHAHGFPALVSTVPVGSPESVQALEEADMVVSNTHVEVSWTKKAGARYLQTWHGTPLKRVHNDILDPSYARLRELDADVARWDILLSPNAASTGPLRSAFGFDGEVFESGYPRNDVLLSADRDAIRAKVRSSLDIADDVIAVLYTPTYRDNTTGGGWQAEFELAIDVAAATQALGPGYALLMRPHYFVSHLLGELDLPAARDVAMYPEVAELYLAADVMVTDYSSTMFDFAVTGKPLVYYAYDLEHYRDRNRGFYVDITADPPGPVTRTQDELVAALRGLPDAVETFRPAYQRFHDKYAALEDGRATERVLRRYFAA